MFEFLIGDYLCKKYTVKQLQGVLFSVEICFLIFSAFAKVSPVFETIWKPQELMKLVYVFELSKLLALKCCTYFLFFSFKIEFS